MTGAVERWLALVVLAGAALGAIAYLARVTWRAYRLVDKLHALLTHEFNPNDGSTIKDDVLAIATSVGELQGDVADLRKTKQLAHELLQLQLDTLVRELDIDMPGESRHRRESEGDTS